MKINNEEYVVIAETTNYYGEKTVLVRKLSDNLYCVLGATQTGLSLLKENIKSFNEAKEVFYKYEG